MLKTSPVTLPKKHQDGLLSVHLPKAEGAKAKSIKINSEQSQQKKIEVGQAS
jgi:HSP20 family molecular chaperone IbpA